MRGFSEHADARKEAEKKARQLSSGDATAAHMRNSEATSFGRSTEILRPTGAPLEIAAAVYAKCYEILGGEYAIARKPVAEVVTELITAKEARGKSTRYIGDLRPLSQGSLGRSPWTYPRLQRRT